MADSFRNFVDGINLKPLSADPTNLKNGDIFVSDGTVRAKGMWQYKDGVITQIGSGSASGINYIVNGDAESSTTGWATYADAAGDVPVDGTGVGANITFAQNAVSPLRGINDFLLTKGGSASRRGEGVSYDLTIDSADQAQMLTLEFDYKTSANYVDDDIRVFLYDVTNGILIYPPDQMLKANAAANTARFSFQTSSNSVAYRVCFHIASTNANDYTINLDNVSLGPKEVVRGVPVTDWTSYPPVWTSSGGGAAIGNGIITGRWRRVGKEMEFDISCSFGTTTTFDTGTYYWSIPSGSIIDTTSLALNAYSPIGTIVFLDAGVAWYTGTATIGSTSTVSGYWDSASNTNVFSHNLPITWASSDMIRIRGSVPIVGWSSNTIMSSDAGNKDIMFNARLGGGSQTLTAGAYRDIIFDTKVTDTTNSLNLSTGIFTVPESGKYMFDTQARIIMGATTATDAALVIYQNAVIRASDYQTDLQNSETYNFKGSCILDCVKGDTIKVAVYPSGQNVTAADEYCYFSGAKLANPQTIQQDELIFANYSNAAATSIANNSPQVVVFPTKITDTHNAFDGATGVFTVPASGVYRIDGFIQLASNAGWADGEYAYLSISGNFVATEYPRYTGTTAVYMSGGLTKYYTKGETISLTAWQNSGGAIALSATGTVNQISIVRLK